MRACRRGPPPREACAKRSNPPQECTRRLSGEAFRSFPGNARKAFQSSPGNARVAFRSSPENAREAFRSSPGKGTKRPDSLREKRAKRSDPLRETRAKRFDSRVGAHRAAQSKQTAGAPQRSPGPRISPRPSAPRPPGGGSARRREACWRLGNTAVCGRARGGGRARAPAVALWGGLQGRGDGQPWRPSTGAAHGRAMALPYFPRDEK